MNKIFNLVGMFSATLLSFWVLFTWQMAILLMIILFIHEIGHYTTAEFCDIKVKSMVFIPFAGAAVHMDHNASKLSFKYSFICLNGPFFGFLMAVNTYLIYLITKNPFWSAVTFFTAIVNVLNLLPLLPFDGGKIVETIGSSIQKGVENIFLSVGFVFCFYFAIELKSIILIITVLIGLAFLFMNFIRITDGQHYMSFIQGTAIFFVYLLLLSVLCLLCYISFLEPDCVEEIIRIYGSETILL